MKTTKWTLTRWVMWYVRRAGDAVFVRLWRVTQRCSTWGFRRWGTEAWLDSRLCAAVQLADEWTWAVVWACREEVERGWFVDSCGRRQRFLLTCRYLPFEYDERRYVRLIPWDYPGPRGSRDDYLAQWFPRSGEWAQHVWMEVAYADPADLVHDSAVLRYQQRGPLALLPAQCAEVAA